jgi:acid phosphatase
MFTTKLPAVCCLLAALALQPAQAALPRYAHVVIAVMENHGLAQIVGNPAAPYISALALQGANFTNAHGIGHPSQPNYLALFSGRTQGIMSDSCPHTFAGTDNLGAQLAAAGLSFAGYSESLPAAGYTGCRSGHYVRKHNPWVNFPNVPASANLPFSAFPDDYAALPTVSFVVPNLANDMHDGSVSTGDAWLKAKLDGYAQWAKTHDSLLIVTFDEDDYSTSSNLVPTILVGAGIVPGNYGEPVNHYNVLATIGRIYALPPLTGAAPLAGAFAPRAVADAAPATPCRAPVEAAEGVTSRLSSLQE